MAKQKYNTTTPLPVVTKKQVGKITDEAHQSVVRELATNCVRVAFNVNWFSQRKQASAATRSTMVDAVNGKTSGFSISKRLITSKHPLVKELYAAKKQIFDYRDSQTIVIAADTKKVDVDKIVLDDGFGGDVNDTIEGEGEVSSSVVRGLRLIPKAKVKEFWDGFWARVKVLMDQAQKVQDNLEEIKNHDRELLGDAFDEDDYPTNIVTDISIQGPTFSTFEISVDLPPEVYQAQLKDIEMQLSSTVGTAMNHIGNEIIEAFSLLASRLVSPHLVKTKLPEFKQYYGAEIRLIRPAPEQDGVAMTAITLRWEVMDKKKKQFVEETLTLPEATWKEQLVPMPTSHRNKLFSSSMDNVLKILENFDNVKAMLGEYGKGVDDQLDPIRKVISKLSSVSNGTAEGIMDVLRDERTARKDLADVLSSVAASVQTALTEAETVGRRVNSKYIKKSIGNDEVTDGDAAVGGQPV